MATYIVTDDQYREVDAKMGEIKRQLNQPNGSPLDPEDVSRKLQHIIQPSLILDPSPLHPTAAAQIMGTSFHGSHDVEQHFGHKFTAQQRKALKTVPFSAAVLQQCRDTHILVAGAPRSIIDIHGKAKQAFYAKDDPWYGAQAFGQEKVEVRWYLIRKDIVPNSTSKTWRKQLSLMDETETVPAACVLVYAVVLHYLAAGERLRPSIYVSTTDVDSGGSRVCVSFFSSDGLRFGYWGDYRSDIVGVSGSRKFG